MAFLGIGSNKKITRRARNRAQEGVDQAQEQLGSSNESVDALLSQISGLADSAHAGGNRTVDERFGRQLESTQDRIQANTAGAQNSVSQALMAGGGDVTGTGAAMLAGVSQQGNEAQSDAINQYKTMTDELNRYDTSRGDNLTAQALQGAETVAGRSQNMYNTQNQFLNNAEMLEIQRRQANRQLGLNTVSTLLDAGNNAGLFGGGG